MSPETRKSSRRDLWLLATAWVAALILSGIAPNERGTWVVEVLPVVIALPILWATRDRFVFSTLAYGLILIHGLILIYGGAYTYARVPLGDWLRDWLHTERNPYDKIGHFAQGFVPAIVAREILIRHFRMARGGLLTFVVICICGTITAVYEIIEWQGAVWYGADADSFLGLQGDPFDSQSDMLVAFVGGFSALVLLSAIHDRSMRKVDPAS